MTERPTRWIATLPTHHVAIALGVAFLGARVGWTGGIAGLVAVWTYAVVTEMHRALPVHLFETLEEFHETFLRDLIVTALLLASVPLGLIERLVRGTGLGAAPAARVLGAGLVLGVLVYGFILSYRVVRHVLSAVATLETGSTRTVPQGHVLFGVLIAPLYVLLTHVRVRDALLKVEWSAR